MISSPVVCAMDTSCSNKSIHSDSAFGGRYTVQAKNGLVFGKVNSDHNVSMLDISSSERRLQFSELL